MRRASPQFATELHFPLHSRPSWGIDPGSEDWITELQEMRGRVLFDGGRRPRFLTADGTCRDPDPRDSLSYHVIVRVGGNIVGCARVTPLTAEVRGVVESTMGTDAFEGMLERIGVSRATSTEASRWIVVPEFRGRGLGFHLVAASWAVGCWLGAQVGFVAAGTRNQQDKMLLKMGAQSTSLPLIPSDEFDDDLHVLHFARQPAPPMIPWVERMTTALGLDCLVDESFAGKGLE